MSGQKWGCRKKLQSFLNVSLQRKKTAIPFQRLLFPCHLKDEKKKWPTVICSLGVMTTVFCSFLKGKVIYRESPQQKKVFELSTFIPEWTFSTYYTKIEHCTFVSEWPGWWMLLFHHISACTHDTVDCSVLWHLAHVTNCQNGSRWQGLCDLLTAGEGMFKRAQWKSLKICVILM